MRADHPARAERLSARRLPRRRTHRGARGRPQPGSAGALLRAPPHPPEGRGLRVALPRRAVRGRAVESDRDGALCRGQRLRRDVTAAGRGAAAVRDAWLRAEAALAPPVRQRAAQPLAARAAHRDVQGPPHGDDAAARPGGCHSSGK